MIERRSDLRALPARPAHHAPVRGDLTPLSAIIPAVIDDLLERCETYRATHRESA